MRGVWVHAFCRRRLLGVILAGEFVVSGIGCRQNFYYYGDACAPAVSMPSTVTSGAVCDVPTEVVTGRTQLADGSSRSTIVSGTVSGKSSRVVVSEPSEPAKVAWKRSDPDAPTTTTEGTIDDPSVQR